MHRAHPASPRDVHGWHPLATLSPGVREQTPGKRCGLYPVQHLLSRFGSRNGEAVAALRYPPGIIIDLAGNPGGDPSVAEQLAAQFVDGQVFFGNFNTRAGIMDRMVIGKNVYTGPLVILIDAMSFSASEHFSSGMQALGRAVVIGERTPGGASVMKYPFHQMALYLAITWQSSWPRMTRCWRVTASYPIST